MKGYVRNIIPFSSVDGPGNRTVLFLQGCNLDCLYCHNPETIEFATVDKLIEGVELVDHIEIVDRLIKYSGFTKGVTISGGECTSQYKFLIEICKELKNRGLEVYLDTNGLLKHEKFVTLCEYVDKFMFDIKSFDENEHIMLTGSSNKAILENLRYALDIDKVFEVRTVIVPKVLNNFRNVVKVSKMISGHNVRYKIIKFRNKGVRDCLKGVKSPSDDYMSELRRVATSYGVKDILIV